MNKPQNVYSEEKTVLGGPAFRALAVMLGSMSLCMVLTLAGGEDFDALGHLMLTVFLQFAVYALLTVTLVGGLFKVVTRYGFNKTGNKKLDTAARLYVEDKKGHPNPYTIARLEEEQRGFQVQEQVSAYMAKRRKSQEQPEPYTPVNFSDEWRPNQ